MGIKTDIEWCDSTLNLEMGCDGCELWRKPKPGDKDKSGEGPCYAAGLTARYAGLSGWPVSFGQPKIFPERLAVALRWSDLTGKDRPGKPWLNGYPRLIFLNDMGDTFTESLDLNWLDPFIARLRSSKHVYIILTKRPDRMRRYFTGLREVTAQPIPANFWLLTSITGAENLARIKPLLDCGDLGAKVLGISWEPAVTGLDLGHFIGGPDEDGACLRCGCRWQEEGITDPHECPPGFGARPSWLIIGGESGPGARPFDIAWVRQTIAQCKTAGVACFVKQLGAKPRGYSDDRATEDRLGVSPFNDRKGGDWSEWPADLRVREFPEGR